MVGKLNRLLREIEEAEHEHSRVEKAFNEILAEEDLPPAVRSTVYRESALIAKNLERLEQAREHHRATAAP